MMQFVASYRIIILLHVHAYTHINIKIVIVKILKIVRSLKTIKTQRVAKSRVKLMLTVTISSISVHKMNADSQTIPRENTDAHRRKHRSIVQR